MRFVMIVIAFFVFAQSASAQTANIKAGVSVQEIVRILAAGDSVHPTLPLEGDEMIPAAANYPGGPLDISNRQAAMNAVLIKSGLEAIEADDRIIIRRKQTETRDSAARQELNQDTPEYGDREGWIRWLWQKATPEQKEKFRTRARRSDYDPCMYGDAGCVRYRPMDYSGDYREGRMSGSRWPAAAATVGHGGYSLYRRGYGRPIYSGGHMWFPELYLWEFFQEAENRQLYGLLKIDGPDSQHRNVRVKVNDVDKGVASKYDQKVNGAIVVRVKDTPDGSTKTLKVDFVKEKDGGIHRFTRFVEIEPFEVARFENLTWLRVDNELFKSAEIRDTLAHQSLPDSMEGGPVPSVKAPPEKKKRRK